MRYLFLGATLLVAGCGGAVDDGAPSPSPSPSSTTNAPNSMASGDGCARACDRMTGTCAAYEDPTCVDSCSASFNTPAKASAFAACIDELSCDDIRRGATMDYGPIGECWTRARRGP
jgi:hypothetical protein